MHNENWSIYLSVLAVHKNYVNNSTNVNNQVESNLFIFTLACCLVYMDNLKTRGASCLSLQPSVSILKISKLTHKAIWDFSRNYGAILMQNMICLKLKKMCDGSVILP